MSNVVDKEAGKNSKVVNFIVGKLVSPIGILASVGIAVVALVTVLITTQVQDCTKENNGFATVIYHISTQYAGYAVFITASGSTDDIVDAFYTGKNDDVFKSIKPGRYHINSYYVNSDQNELMRDLVRNGLYLPDQDTYSGYDPDIDVRLCAGDEYHILAWIQP